MRIPFSRVAPVLLAGMLAGCHSRPARPVEIERSDMCGHCRMAISERQFAAEILDADENATKFDDIGCLLHYLDSNRDKVVNVFVVDYVTRRWLDANAAYFVRVKEIATPMGGGIIALGDRQRAETFAREHASAVVRFAELTSGRQP